MTKTVTICNSRGLHARAAAKFVALSRQFQASVQVTRDQETVDADSIMELLMLAAGPGTPIAITAGGPDAEAAAQALAALVEAGFEESD
ncbi:MAG: HPr family phosphocarrier protein [Maricaulaceae bacterium]|nr:HPr family phosphocarrier protein [Maricaulaceae bacterium]